MSFPFTVAVASTDGIRSDAHFGKAGKFYLFRVAEDGSAELLSIRPAYVPTEEDRANAEAEVARADSCGCGGAGGGCGGHGNLASLEPLVSHFKDCDYILAARIGSPVEKAFRAHGISCFSLEVPTEEAIQKLVTYERRLNQFR